MKWSVILFWFVILVVTLFHDRDLLFWVTEHRVNWLDPFMLFFTDFGLLFGMILFGVALFEKHLFKQLLLIMMAFAGALEASYLFKMLFGTVRPYETWDFVALKTAEGFSFPSMHAAFIFAALPFFRGPRLRKYRWVWVIFAVLVAFSRVYVGVHYVSDVLAGAILGYGIGALLFYLEKEYRFTDWVNHHVKDKFEVRRQVGHALLGVGMVFLLRIGMLTPGLLLAALLVGGILSLLLLHIKIPVIYQILEYFERPHHLQTFPGRGSFFMVMGALLSLLLFELNIAMAAIAIMALGDSVTNIFGRYFGKLWLPYNRKKTLEGVSVGVVAATLGAFFFVPLYVAFLASVVAMFVETWDLKIGIEIDDNVLVPLVAGVVMTVI